MEQVNEENKKVMVETESYSHTWRTTQHYTQSYDFGQVPYHIWGKIIDSDNLHAFWVPKSQIVPSERKKIEIDYTPFSNRPPMEHQKPAIEKLLQNDLYILIYHMRKLCVQYLGYQTLSF